MTTDVSSTMDKPEASSVSNSSIITPFASTYSSITNENDTWGPQDRTGQWYLGVGASGLADSGNSPSGGAANFLLGYNINKYFAVQYNQIVGKHFAGIGEGVLNLSNSTMFTPYAAAGAGWGTYQVKQLVLGMLVAVLSLSYQDMFRQVLTIDIFKQWLQ